MWPAELVALTSAALFGLSTPIAKWLLGAADPWIVAGILYGGAGFGLLVVQILRGDHRTRESRLSERDLPWLGGAILMGGIVGPVLLMLGLTRIDGTAASLLLTLEGVFTAAIAWFVFRENVDRQIAIGMACILAGSLVLNAAPHIAIADLLGPLAIAGACLAWAVDNNLTRKVSLSDPVQIAAIKGLIAGPINFGIGLVAGATWPSFSITLAGLATGFLGYGVSLVLFVLALRRLGTARTAAYFSVAPFLGAAAAVPLLGEAPTLNLAAAGSLMAIGVWLHLSERHAHKHEHEALAHEHSHAHDEHHNHPHEREIDPRQSHSHPHRHRRMRHSHRHVPDSHHRHRH